MTSASEDGGVSRPPGDEGTRFAELRRDLLEVYRQLDEDVARLGPSCALSGRCCRFQEYGHTLFLSGPEAEILLADAPDFVRPVDDGATCPWQDSHGRCTAREARPLGCRVYFCDTNYSPHAPELTERYLARLRSLADRHEIAWDYAPLHRHLQARAAARPRDESLPPYESVP